MIDHKVIWPEMGFDMTISQDEESDSVQRTFSYYSESENEGSTEGQDDFDTKIQENPAFRRFLITLHFLQKTLQVVVVAGITLSLMSALTSYGYLSVSSGALFWSLLIAASVLFAIDWGISRIWISPIRQVSIYTAGLFVLLTLVVYFGVRRQGRNLSTLFEYATAQISDKLLVEQLVRTGRKLDI